MGEKDASEGTDERTNQAPDGGGRETGGETETAPSVPSENREFDAFKMEYEKAAERYENVYRAVWQNFYYMAFFAGGIFAFGPARLPLPLLAAIGLVPLVFWF